MPPAVKKPLNHGTVDGRRYTPIKAEEEQIKILVYPDSKFLTSRRVSAYLGGKRAIAF
jgi:predicted lipoprotein